MVYALVVHGGAGAQPRKNYSMQRTHTGRLIVEGQRMLEGGRRAFDIVVEIVAAFEASGLYVAGKGSGPNTAGGFELDASVMDGGRRWKYWFGLVF